MDSPGVSAGFGSFEASDFPGGFFCLTFGNPTNFGLEFCGPWMALIDDLDVRGGQGSALVPPVRPRAFGGGEEGEGGGLTFLEVSMGVFQKPGFGVFDCLIGVNLDWGLVRD